MALSAERFARACIMDIREHGTRLVLAGPTGTGKTHAAESITRYIKTRQIDAWARGWWLGNHIPSPCFLKWPLEVQARDDQWEDTLAEVRQARLIVIDDLGAENDRFKNDEAASRLLVLMDILKPSWKWVLVTTNVPVAKWKYRWDQRIADRLMTYARIDLTTAPSFRVNNKGAR